MEIGEKIRNRRKELGLTLEEVGNRCEASKSTVRKWELGIIKNMRRDKIVKLAKALDVAPEYLMGWSDDPHHKEERKIWEEEFKSGTFTPEEVDEIMNFARFLLSKRKK